MHDVLEYFGATHELAHHLLKLCEATRQMEEEMIHVEYQTSALAPALIRHSHYAPHTNGDSHPSPLALNVPELALLAKTKRHVKGSDLCDLLVF